MSTQPDPQREARRLLDEYYARLADADLASFDEVVSAHPALAANLRALYDQEIHPQGERVRRLLAESGLSDPQDMRYFHTQSVVHEGGQGFVLEVEDLRLRRRLAMKVIKGVGEHVSPRKGAVRVDPGSLRRFIDEARVTAQLFHPAIIPVYDVGVGEGGRVFYTMPYVRERTFAEVAELARNGAEGWSLERGVQVLQRVCEALAYAHSCRVIHRDLKPSNVMVGRFGEVYVVDWGLAHVLGAAARSGAAERAGPKEKSVVLLERELCSSDPEDPIVSSPGIKGTPAYMSPEQARGAAVDELSDVYALGALLYYLLGGCPPHSGDAGDPDQGEVVRRAREEQPKPISARAPHAPPELVAICERAMMREPAERYPSAEALGADLQSFLEVRPVRAYRTGWVPSVLTWVRRNQLAAACLFFALVAVALGAGITVPVLMRLGSERLVLATEQSRIAVKEAELRGTSEAAYAAHLSWALLETRAGVPSKARWRLDECPEELRGWEWRHLDASQDASVEEHPLGSFPVALDASRDGRRAVLATSSGLAFWEPAGPSPFQLRRASSEPFQALVCTADGAEVYIGGQDGNLSAWEFGADRPRAIQPAHGEAIVAVDLDEQNGRIASASTHEVRVWDSRTLAPAADIATIAAEDLALGSHEHVRDVRFVSGGSSLLVLAGGGRIRLRGLDTGDLREIEMREYVGCLDVAPSGSIVAIGNPVGEIRLLDLATGTYSRTLSGHRGFVRALQFSPDGLALGSGGADHTLRLWSLDEGRARVLHGHTDEVSDLAFVAGTDLLVTTSRDQTLRVWDPARSGPRVPPALGLDDEVDAVAYSSAEGLLVAGTGEGAMWILGAGGGPPVRRVVLDPEDSVTHVVAARSTGRVAAGTFGGQLYVLDLPEGELVAVRPVKDPWSVTAMALSADGNRLVAAYDDGAVLSWSAPDWRGPERLLKANEMDTAVVCLSLDGGTVVLSRDGSLWVQRSGVPGLALIWEHEGSDFPPESSAVALSPDGAQIALALGGAVGGPSSILLVDPSTGIVEHELLGHDGSVLALAYSEAGDRLLSGDADGRLCAWDPRSGILLLPLESGAPISSLSISPDGRAVAAAGESHEDARLWFDDREGAFRAWDAYHVEREGADLASQLLLEHETLEDALQALTELSGLDDDVRRAAARQLPWSE